MKKIPLTQGYFALVDDEDFVWLATHKWCVSKRINTSYAVRSKTIGYKKHEKVQMHRLIIGLSIGDKQECDHIDGNGLNNQKNNLRVCNKQQNQGNSGSTKNSTSKYKGVCWDQHNQKWHAQISMCGKAIHLGCFSSEEDAARMYDKVALFEFKKFARINFPRENYSDTELLSIRQALAQRRKRKTSRFKGVSWDKKNKKWVARIGINGKRIHLGSFHKEQDAAIAYDQASETRKDKF